MKRIVMIIMAVALVALPSMAQTFGEQEPQNAAFQSTSTMQGSGSTYSANPSLNADGTAYNPAVSNQEQTPAKAPNGPRKINPIASPGPVGDAVVPLLLMSLAFGMFVYFRRKRSAA